MSKHEKIRRRTVLKGGMAAVAGAAILGKTGAHAVETQPPAAGRQVETVTPGQIPTRPFGSTGVTLPVLGMGGSAMVEVWAGGYGVKLGSREERAAMVRNAFDQGVRFFDTARVYAESESVMGKGLADVREQAFIASKVANPDPGQTRRSVEQSLRELGTDYVDLMQIHSPAIEQVGVKGAMKIHEQLVKLRDEKLIRHIGLTTHVAFKDVLELINTGGFEQVLLACGYFPKGMDTLLSSQNLEYRNQCLARAHEQGMAIVAMKVMGAFVMGHNAKNVVPAYAPADLAKLPGAAIRWVLNDERISMLNLGTSLPVDIERNREILTANLELTEQDRFLLADYSSQAFESPWVNQMTTV